MLRTKKWKLVIRSAEDAKEELYNMEDDPQEFNNLIDDPEFMDIQLDLKNKLLDWYLKTSDNPHWYHKRDL
ncbi:MAG: sulfatase/phosphatase domain-containing protein [Promethearchaeia archaeon]